MKVEIEWIDPEKAHAYLLLMRPNRTLSDFHVRKLAREMLEGRFRSMNGDAIRFDIDGRLADGQHRLHALIRAGLTMQFLVVRELEHEDFPTIDLGKTRTAANVLSAEGETNSTVLAAGLRWINGYHVSQWKEEAPKPNPREILQLLTKYPDIRDSVGVVHHSSIRSLMPPSVSVSLHYVISHVDKDKADVFFWQLISGENLTREDPVHLLRERLIRERGTNRSKLRQITTRAQLAWCVFAWNAYRLDRKLKFLRAWNPGHEFPDVL